MENKTALQIFCENLEHNMSIETFSFYNSLKKDCLEIEKQQTIDVLDRAIELFKANKKCQIISVKNAVAILEQLKSKV
jgi:hypothetical protein